MPRRTNNCNCPTYLNLLIYSSLIVLFPRLEAQNIDYIKRIKDTSNVYLMGSAVYLDTDSENIYALINGNTAILPFNPSKRSSYYAKIKKSNGQLLSSTIFSVASGSITINGACRNNNSLYVTGNQTFSTNLSSTFIYKFNLQTNTVLWQRHFGALTNMPRSLITDIKLNLNKSKIIFCGEQNLKDQFRAMLDTNNAFLSSHIYNGYTFGIVFPAINNLQRKSKFVLSNISSRQNIIFQDTLTNKISLFLVKNSENFWNFPFWDTIRLTNLKANDFFTNVKIGNQILNVVEDTSGTNLFITDTSNTILSSKRIPFYHAKSVTVNSNKVLLTMVNDIGADKACEIIHLNMNYSLSILSSKKMDIDTFRISQLTCKSVLDVDTAYTIFNKKKSDSQYFYLYRCVLGSALCNEQFINIASSTLAINNSISVISGTSIIFTGQGTVIPTIKLFKESSYCFTGNTPYPIVSFSSNPVCPGGIINLVNTSSNSPTNFYWQLPIASPSTSSLQNPTLTMQVAGTQIATLTASNLFGSQTATGAILIWPQPTIGVISGSICPGNSYTILPNGASTYTFLNGSAIVSPTTITNYSVIGTSSNGCISINTAVCQVGLYSIPSLSVNSDVILACIGDQVTLTCSGAVNYTWSTNTTGSLAVVIPTAHTTYSVIGLDFNGCKNTASYLVKISHCTNVFETEPLNKANILFPIPCDKILNLDLRKIHFEANSNLQLVDLLGQIIIDIPINLAVNNIKKKTEDNIIQFDLGTIKSGIYFLQILENEKLLLRHRIIKE